jgi:hypothetical protein
MNRYWANAILSYYESYLFFKINVFRNLRFIFSSLKTPLFHQLWQNYYIFWKNVFRPTFWISRRKLKKLRPSLYNNYVDFARNKRFFYFSKFFKNSFLIYLVFNKTSTTISDIIYRFAHFEFNFIFLFVKLLKVYKKAFGDGFIYLRGLAIIFFIDASFTDDEPLWEPVEWSLVQTWLVFIFMFAWIAENLITGRYGSYTGRDKRVWFGWYKTFWLIEFWYLLSYGTAVALVIVPFYWELTYNISLVFSWWNWYTRLFFFKFVSIYSITLVIATVMQINIRWLNWKKLTLFVLFINFFIAYLLYTHFIMSFFGYFTDPLWYQKTRFIDYVQLSHEPLKWGWGPAKRDHFTYHRISTVFWFKNDGPFAGAFLMMHLFLFATIFFIYVYWLTLLRRIYTTKEITYTFSTFCISALKQFYFFFLFLYGFVFLSYLINYWRFPIEFLWVVNTSPWFFNFLIILKDYVFFLLSIF